MADDAQTEVAPSTDVVTRATQDGVQLVTVLANNNASGKIRFGLDLPTDATLSTNADGSIAIIAPVETAVAEAGELARFEREVHDIIGSVSDVSDLSGDQRDAVAALTPPSTERKVANLEIGRINAPWAVDANGASVATHYAVNGSMLEQIVEVGSATNYPVTVDPRVTFSPFEISISFNKSEVKKLASKSSYFAIGSAACGVVSHAVIAVPCGSYAAVVLTNIGNVLSKAASKKQCARVTFYYAPPAVNIPVYGGTTRYSC